MSTPTNTYLVSARKYRPSTFRSVVGQPALASTLKNAIGSRRLAQAYLFCGPRGVGKTSCARIFAKTINCLNPDAEGEACGQCESCRAIDLGNSFDLVELDAASNNSVDDIRAINEQVNVPPQKGRYRVFIIDEVHMLSNSAFNAFLKTLEEPPANVIFILATTEKHKVIPTILSRCQIYDFKRITVEDIIDHLAYVAEREGVSAEREALGVIANKADGAMRDALSIFDQVAASTGGNVSFEKTLQTLNVLDYEFYFKIVEAFREGNVADALLIHDEIRTKGFDSLFFINGLASHIRDLMVAADARTVKLLEKSQEVSERYQHQASEMPLPWYYNALKILNDTDVNYRTATNKRLLVELALIRLCQLGDGTARPFEEPDRLKPLSNPASADKAASPLRSQGDSQPATPSSRQTYEGNTEPARPAVAEPIQKRQSNRVKTSTGSTLKRPPKSFRISEVSSPEASTGTQEMTTNGDISTESFNKYWHEFAESNSDQAVLYSAMRSIEPALDKDLVCHVEVDHPAQQKAFELALPRMVTFFRDRFKNDSISVKITMRKIEADPRHLPPKEFLKKIVEGNKPLGDFLSSIECEII